MNPYPRLNLLLTVLGVLLWAWQPAAVESGRLDPPLADVIFEEGNP